MGPRASNWGVIRPFNRVGKLNKTLTIPTFSVRCGPINQCLLVGESPLAVTGAFGSAGGHTTLTLEAWVSVFYRPVGLLRTIVAEWSGASAQSCFALQLDGNFVQFKVRIGGVDTTVTSTNPIGQDEWTHVCVTYSGASVKHYINGVLDKTTALAGPIDCPANQSYYNVGYGYLAAAPFVGKLGRIIVRTTVLTDEQVLQQYNRFRNIIPADGIDDEIYKLFTFEGALKERIAGTTGVVNVQPIAPNEWLDEYPPIGYGGSFIPIIFTVISDVGHSLKYPITRPTGANFGLCVSWLDDSGNLQRRRLFEPESGSLDVSPLLVDYNGEELPVTYKLEIWNKDGAESVDLTSALTFDTSILTNPTFSTDHAKVALTAPTQKIALYEPFPLTGFPLEFNNPATDWI